ncbi:MAG: phage tail protein [Deltaproteobacteria bacterium]|nr:phage tail protein [Deltaproteobacteria bacterium]
MPGFKIPGSGDDKSKDHKAEFLRKHRWRITGTDIMTAGEWIYLKKAARPSFQLEEVVVHHDQEEAYFAGKQKWEEITLEFYDVTEPKNITDKLWKWVNEVVVIPDVVVNVPKNYKKDNLKIQCTDGKGGVIHEWTLFGVWPKTTNWNDLDYESTDIQTVTVTMRFDRAHKTH